MSFNETLAPNDIPEMKYRYHYSLHELIPSNEIEREKKCNSFAFCARICKFIFFESSNFASSVTHTHTLRRAGPWVVWCGCVPRRRPQSSLGLGLDNGVCCSLAVFYITRPARPSSDDKSLQSPFFPFRSLLFVL